MTENIVTEKQCSRCGERRPLVDFCKYAPGKLGVYHYCRDCQRANRKPKPPEPIIDLPGEEWRECIENTDYAVSNMGRVKRVKGGRGTNSEKLLTLIKSHYGYSVTHLGVDCQVRVHRLVCRAFHGEPRPEQRDVNHINHIRDDNRAENLHWCTTQENTDWGIQAGRNNIGARNGAAKLTEDKVLEIRHIKGSEKISNLAIGRRFNVSGDTIDKIISRKTWKHLP